MVLQVPASVVFVFFHVGGREVNYSSWGKRCTSVSEVQASREGEPRRVKSSGKLLTPFSERTVVFLALMLNMLRNMLSSLSVSMDYGRLT